MFCARCTIPVNAPRFPASPRLASVERSFSPLGELLAAPTPAALRDVEITFRIHRHRMDTDELSRMIPHAANPTHNRAHRAIQDPHGSAAHVRRVEEGLTWVLREGDIVRAKGLVGETLRIDRDRTLENAHPVKDLDSRTSAVARIHEAVIAHDDAMRMSASFRCRLSRAAYS